MEPQEIGDRGEQIVADWFSDNDYAVKKNTALPGSTDIEAVGGKDVPNFLVQVKTAVAPNEPEEPTDTEKSNIAARAAILGWEARIALVVIDAQGNLQGKIVWSRA